jgi:Domain of unknown function (DUF4190)
MSRPNPPTRAAPSYAPPRTQRTNKKAIWSLVFSIIWLGGLGSVAGIWLGVVARREMAGTGERGARLAIAGIIVGVITLLFAIGYWVFVAAHTGGGGGYGGGGY